TDSASFNICRDDQEDHGNYLGTMNNAEERQEVKENGEELLPWAAAALLPGTTAATAEVVTLDRSSCHYGHGAAGSSFEEESRDSNKIDFPDYDQDHDHADDDNLWGKRADSKSSIHDGHLHASATMRNSRNNSSHLESPTLPLVLSSPPGRTSELNRRPDPPTTAPPPYSSILSQQDIPSPMTSPAIALRRPSAETPVDRVEDDDADAGGS
ncbi:unnamed protein product, partial [Amoebophrya sp. A120]